VIDLFPPPIADFVREHGTLFAWVGGISFLIMLIGMVGLPLLAILLPADAIQRHFDRPADHGGDWRSQHPVIRWTLKIAKNLAGLILAAAGVLMLVLPGQGVLALIAAFILLDVPGKQKFERKLLTSPRFMRPINALRKRFGKPALLPPRPVNAHHRVQKSAGQA
jgi:MFS family permease